MVKTSVENQQKEAEPKGKNTNELDESRIDNDYEQDYDRTYKLLRTKIFCF